MSEEVIEGEEGGATGNRGEEREIVRTERRGEEGNIEKLRERERKR